jgi:hypothetical protein
VATQIEKLAEAAKAAGLPLPVPVAYPGGLIRLTYPRRVPVPVAWMLPGGRLLAVARYQAGWPQDTGETISYGWPVGGDPYEDWPVTYAAMLAFGLGVGVDRLSICGTPVIDSWEPRALEVHGIPGTPGGPPLYFLQ